MGNCFNQWLGMNKVADKTLKVYSRGMTTINKAQADVDKQLKQVECQLKMIQMAGERKGFKYTSAEEAQIRRLASSQKSLLRLQQQAAAAETVLRQESATVQSNLLTVATAQTRADAHKTMKILQLKSGNVGKMMDSQGDFASDVQDTTNDLSTRLQDQANEMEQTNMRHTGQLETGLDAQDDPVKAMIAEWMSMSLDAGRLEKESPGLGLPEPSSGSADVSVARSGNARYTIEEDSDDDEPDAPSSDDMELACLHQPVILPNPPRQKKKNHNNRRLSLDPMLA